MTHVRATIALAALGLALAAGLPRSAVAATEYFEGWDSGSLAGWEPNTTMTDVELRETGGNPGGYLHTSTISGGTLGASTELPEVSGDYGALRRVSFDLIFLEGAHFTQARFRVRYLSGFYNGWYLRIGGDFPRNLWISFEFWFDPAWTDQQAIAAGWIAEPNGASFAETMMHVYHPEVRILGVAPPMAAGIDNFRLSSGMVSVEDDTWYRVKARYR